MGNYSGTAVFRSHQFFKDLDIKNLIDLVKADENNFKSTLHLTANENILSKTAHAFLSSQLSFRYHLGTANDYFLKSIVDKGDFIFKGMPGIYNLEAIAKNISQHILSAVDSDYRFLSGVHGLISIVAVATNPGDIIYSILPEDGGHFATANAIRHLGRHSLFMKFDRDAMELDLSYLKGLVKNNPPKAIILDHGATLFDFPMKEIRSIVGDKVLIIYDASHTFGLIYGNSFSNPLENGCDILQGNTHKTFPGPQKAMIYFKNKALSKRIITDIGESMVSSQHTHHSIALYITLLEMAQYGTEYARQTILNANILAKELEDLGFDILSKKNIFTNTNCFFIEFNNISNAKDACSKLHLCDISTNARAIFGKPLIRIGTQEVTRLGMKESEMKYIAQLIYDAINHRQSPEITRKKVNEFILQYQNIFYSFDNS